MTGAELVTFLGAVDEAVMAFDVDTIVDDEQGDQIESAALALIDSLRTLIGETS